AGDVLLGTFVHQGALTAGAAYEASVNVTLPVGVSGPFYFLVETNRDEQVFENGATANNVAGTATAKNENLTPPPDLAVKPSAAPATASAGRALIFSYTVADEGAGATPNFTWDEDFYLSPTASYDKATAHSLGRYVHQGALAAGEVPPPTTA